VQRVKFSVMKGSYVTTAESAADLNSASYVKIILLSGITTLCKL
jgi:hypothetical protein